MSGNSAGRFIIQYLDSSAGMVQPTRMVCCPNADETPDIAHAANPATTTHFNAIRFISIFPVPELLKNCSLNFSLLRSFHASNLHASCFLIQYIVLGILRDG